MLTVAACDPAATRTSSDTAPSPAAAPSNAASAAKPHNLAHGAQQGLANCVITYKDAQDGTGTSTFTAYVVDNSGQAYSPADSDPYSVMFQMTVSDLGGGLHSVTENFGSGTRTATDNGGSDWYTTDQGDMKVSTDNTHGVLAATVQERLSAVSAISGNITIMSNRDSSVTSKDCVVRPG
ncbi:hypothetical protein [Streptacidiphilus jiangxiensis]|uniref:hypothetical protein n=1 Tax=Streptacidiphilus jiangxiensis TaxID=235985 RepID=UPI0011600BB0|nr:hypothetical protein [Streptacidiphilus jiangxiensis]